MVGPESVPEPLTLVPRLTGVLNGALALARVDTYMSTRPEPPALSEPKKRFRLSGAINGRFSTAVVLMAAPRFCGADHAVYRCARAGDSIKNNKAENVNPVARFLRVIEWFIIILPFVDMSEPH